jgi:hypothetical protein
MMSKVTRKAKTFQLEIEEHGDYYLCYIPPLPIVGKGASPVDALMSYVEAIPTVYDHWAENLDFQHAQDTKALNSYKELTYMLTNFADEPESATYYTPIK